MLKKSKLKTPILLGIALILNLIWEFSHYPLYNDYSFITGPAHLVIASLGDMFFIFIIIELISLKHWSFKWTKKPKILDYALIVILGIIIAITIEIINVKYLGRWNYKEAMPLIFGFGLSPLVQLAITGILSLEISRRVWKYFRI